jgi:hypothetical protein
MPRSSPRELPSSPPTLPPPYLGRELRFDLLAEPPFSAPVSAARETVSAASGGRASQMDSLTSTISSDSAAKRWYFASSRRTFSSSPPLSPKLRLLG